MTGETYTIGEFAKLMSVSPRTVDFYTREGLLRPVQESPGHGYRHYTEEDKRRMAIIKKLQAQKFSLKEIRQILDKTSVQKNGSGLEIMEEVTSGLDRLQKLVKKTRAGNFGNLTNEQPAMRILAAQALQKATGLCSMLAAFLQEMPLA
ncbi:MAG: MerR family transcriptional regulator [Thermodesulfobacteriota bacterium]